MAYINKEWMKVKSKWKCKVVPNVVYQTFEGSAWLSGRKGQT
jgi:hypothetical protein